MSSYHNDFQVKNGIVVQTTATFLSTQTSTGTSSGAVQVVGGVGIAKDLYVGGTVNITSTASWIGTANNALSVAGSVGIGGNLFVEGTLYGYVLGIISSATNLVYGYTNQIPYQQGPGTTAFFGPGTQGQILVSNGTTPGGPVFTNTSSIYIQDANVSTNIRSGNAGQLVYQTGTNQTGFIATATTGYFLQATTNGAPTWTSTGSMYVYASNYTNNVFGGNVGQLVYQTYPNTTGFISTGNLYVGRSLIADVATSVSNALTIGTGIIGSPVATYNGATPITIALNTGTLMTTSVNIAGGSQGRILYQTAPNSTGFISTGTDGQLLQATTNGAPIFTSTNSVYVSAAVYANNLFGGSAGQIAYQTAPNTTNFISTSNLYVGHAVSADVSVGGASYVLHSITFDNSNSGAATGVSFNGSSSATISANTLGALSLSGGGVVTGPVTFGATVTFNNPVTFNGTATYVLSTNTYYTDNILEIHVPPTGIGTLWTVDDGKDIGLRMHYYNRTLSTDSNAALVLADDSQYLEWYITGSENTQGEFTGTVTYGVFKTGSIVLVNNQIIGSYANSTATISGERLTVYGGGYFNGTVTATNFIGTYVGASTQVQTQAQTANASYYPTFVSANNASPTAMSVYTTSSFAINPSTGYIGINTTAPNAKLSVSNLGGANTSPIPITTADATIHLLGSSGNYNRIYMDAWGGGNVINGRAVGGTYLLPTATTAGQELLLLSAGGYDGTTYYPLGAARIFLSAESTWTTGSTPTQITFSTTPAGTAGGSPNSMIFSSGGNLLISTSSQYSGERLSVNGGGYFTGVVTATSFIGNISTATSAYEIQTSNQTSNRIYYPIFVSNNTSTLTAQYVYTTGTFVINPVSGYLGVYNSSPNYTLDVNGSGNFTNNVYLNAGGGGQMSYGTFGGGSGFGIQASTGRALSLGSNGIWDYFIIAATGQTFVNTTTAYSGERFGVNGGVYVNGTLTATNVVGNITGTAGSVSGILTLGTGLTGSPVSTYNGSVAVTASLNTSTLMNLSVNIASGNQGQIPYQIAPNTTKFINSGTTGQFLQATTNGSPVWTNTGSMYVYRATQADSASGSAGSVAYSLSTGTGILGASYNGSAAVTWSLNTNTVMTTAVNVSGGAAGALVYQSGLGNTAYLSIGGNGTILSSNGNAPIWINTGSIYVYRATIADSVIGGAGSVANNLNIGTGLVGNPNNYFNGSTAVTITLNTATLMTTSVNLANGNAGSIPYQAGSNLTSFLGIGPSGTILTSNGTGPAWTTTGSIYVYRATVADSVSGGISTPGSLTIGSGLSGSPSSSFNGSTSVTVTLNTSTLMNIALNLAGGSTGGIPYQSSSNLTSFLGIGTSGYILTSNGAGPIWTNPSSVSIGTSSAAAAVNTVAQTANANYYLTFVNANNSTPTAENLYTTSSFFINPSTGILNVTPGNSIQSTGNFGVYAANSYYIRTGSPSSYHAAIYIAQTTQNVNIGIETDQGYKLYVNGNGYYNGGVFVNGTVTATNFVGNFSGAASRVANALTNGTGILGASFDGSAAVTWSLNTNTLMTTATSAAIAYSLANTSTTYVGHAVFADIASGPAGSVTNSLSTGTGILGASFDGSAAVTWSLNTATLMNTATSAAIAYSLANTSTTYVGHAVLADSASGSAGSANQVQTQAQTANATYYPTFVSANNASATAMSVYTTSSFSINPSSGVATHGANVIISGIAGGAGNNLVIQGGSGSSSEGAQIVMGYGNNQAPNITGQANYTWNIDVASGVANNDFRIFRQNSAGATVVAAEFTEATGGVQLVSVGVGTTSSGVTGELRATNEITAYYSSDINLKENIRIIEDPITLINQIRGVRFDWKDEYIQKRGGEDSYFVRKHDIGVIAQEVEKVLPEIVAERDDGTKAVKYEKLAALLIESIKEQQKLIENQQKQIEMIIKQLGI
jgi:Chaperone of endosialidase